MGRATSLLHVLVLATAAALPACGGCSGSELSGDAETRDTTTPDTAPPDTGWETPPADSGPDTFADPATDPDVDEEEIPPGIFWARTYGSSEDTWQWQAQGVVETVDGGFIIMGNDQDYPLNTWLVGIEASGNILWQKEYPLSGVEISAGPTADGGIVLASGSWTARFDREGDVVWHRTFTAPSFDSILQTSDGGFIAAGHRNSDPPGSSDIKVLRLDDAGDAIWQLASGVDGEYEGRDVAETSDGSFVVVGIQRFRSVNHDALVIKLDASGAFSWRLRYGGEGYEDARAVAATDDGGAIVAGHRMVSSGTPLHFWAMRIDAAGGIVWRTEIEGSYSDYLRNVDVTDDGGCVLVGSRQASSDSTSIRTDVWVVKLGLDGEVNWQRSYGGSEDSQATSVLQASDGGLVVAGWTHSFGVGNRKAWVLKTASNGLISPSCESTIGAPTLAVAVETDFDTEVGPLSFHETDASSVIEDLSGYETHAASSVQCSM